MNATASGRATATERRQLVQGEELDRLGDGHAVNKERSGRDTDDLS
jgi:hypothetical protein